MAKAKPLVISYLRYSTIGQRLGDSERRQVDQAEAWAKAKGLTLDHRLKDLGVSAWKGANRTEGVLASLLDAIKARRIPKGSTLIIESLDRLSRERVLKAMELFISIINSGVHIVTLRDGQEYTSENIDITKMVLSIVMMAKANDESEQKSERVKAAVETRKKAARAGIPQRQRTPRWIRIDGGKFKVIKSEAEPIRKMMKMISNGVPLKQVATDLGMSVSNVWYWARAKTLIGEYQPKQMARHAKGYDTAVPDGEPIKGYYPPIVSESLFYRVQQLLTSKSRGSQVGKSKWINLFVGKIHSSAGENYVVAMNGKTRAYVLPSAKSGKGDCIYIPARMMESAFAISLQQHGWDFVSDESSETDADISRLSERLRELDEDAAAMKKEILSGARAIDVLPISQQINRQREEIKKALDHITASNATSNAVAAMHEKFAERLNDALSGGKQSKEERLWLRSMVATTVSDITLDAMRFAWRLGGVRAWVTMANGVRLPWFWVFDTNESDVWLPMMITLNRDDLPEAGEGGIVRLSLSGPQWSASFHKETLPEPIAAALDSLLPSDGLIPESR